MIRSTVVLFLLISTIVSCNDTRDLAGMVYEVSREKNSCQAVGKCDCCTADLLFITHDQFCLIDYCNNENKMRTGRYKMTDDSLILDFLPSLVTLGIKWEGQVMNSASETYLKKEVLPRKSLSFKISLCDDSSLQLENSELQNYRFGLRTKANDEEMRIVDLKNSNEWKLISQ